MASFRETFCLIAGFLCVAYGSVVWNAAHPEEWTLLARSLARYWNFVPISVAGILWFSLKLDEIERFGERRREEAELARVPARGRDGSTSHARAA